MDNQNIRLISRNPFGEYIILVTKSDEVKEPTQIYIHEHSVYNCHIWIHDFIVKKNVTKIKNYFVDSKVTLEELKSLLSVDLKDKPEGVVEYLGEIVVNIKDTEYKDYKLIDWGVLWIEKYSHYDGGHHKDWVFDQLMRIYKGTEVIIKLARWSNHEEYRFQLGEPTEEYHKWVREMMDGEDGPNTYNYDCGVAP